MCDSSFDNIQKVVGIPLASWSFSASTGISLVHLNHLSITSDQLSIIMRSFLSYFRVSHVGEMQEMLFGKISYYKTPVTVKLLLILMLFSARVSAQFSYLSPVPGATMVNPEITILIRQGESLKASSINKGLFLIHGAHSGLHDFVLNLSSDRRTIILHPVVPFDYGEEVTVTIHSGLNTESGKVTGEFSFSFFTHREYNTVEKQRIQSRMKEEFLNEVRANNISHTQADIRSVLKDGFEIKVNKAPSPGDIFFDSWNGVTWNSNYDGYHIITAEGDSVYSNPGTHNRVFDFDLNPNGLLSYWNVDVPCYDVLDSNYQLVDQYTAANGYYTDPHEFTMYKDGHVFLIAEDPQIVDMTVYNPGYSDSCLVTGTVIQEFDDKRNLVFEWRSFDHVAFEESNQPMYYDWFDYIHTNSIEIDSDGNIIASHRHLDQVTKIDRNTGEFIWRMGGKENEFTFIDDTEGFNYQHDARRLANGNLTLWDNGNKHPLPHSSAKEYQLDEINKTATLVWNFAPFDSTSGKPVYFLGMGSVQRLSNGNTFINGGWDSGQPQSNMWEVTPSGEVVWELKLNDDAQLVSYRAHKYNWKPCEPIKPAGTHITEATSRTAGLAWNRISNAGYYELQYRKIADTAWLKLSTLDTTVLLNYLFPETTYEWQIRVSCFNGFYSDWSATDTFSTMLSSLFPEEDVFKISTYPVPAQNELTIAWSKQVADDLSVMIFDIDGQLVQSTVLHLNLDMIKKVLDVSSLPQGFYFLKTESGNGQSFSPFVIQRQ